MFFVIETVKKPDYYQLERKSGHAEQSEGEKYKKHSFALKMTGGVKVGPQLEEDERGPEYSGQEHKGDCHVTVDLVLLKTFKLLFSFEKFVNMTGQLSQ